ncbi:hypothetical protein EJ03DRAFT_131248 [Teratosphaeria nubilosa]|uniref:F-box domain-containing protein n=1 Tax=Teratosphaeria nubilosa TaxID=161662 RepID=A0A6G1LKD0_9PEZI|nr:hypothetical protein EJ03DRAFT_131248 [Teratosphaeria nubilosa]
MHNSNTVKTENTMAEAPSTIVGAAESDQQEQPFRLLDLPPELWSNICKLAVLSEDTIVFELAKPRSQNQIAVGQPSITQVCRLLRAEALPLFYALNVFRVQDEDDGTEASSRLQCWLRGIGLKNRGYLRKVEVFAPYDITDSKEFFAIGAEEDGNVKLELELVKLEVRPDKHGVVREERTYDVHFAEAD